MPLRSVPRWARHVAAQHPRSPVHTSTREIDPSLESMVTRAQPEITKVLGLVAAGDREAVNRLFPMLYDELRRIAAAQMQSERKGHTLQATALVNEAYLKLVDQRGANFQNRAHFLALGAVMMRRILIEHARGRNAKKRGGDVVTVNFEDAQGRSIDLDRMIDFDAALAKLERLDERQVRIVELRFFGGLSMEEISSTLDVSLRTAEGDWQMARAWLKRELGGWQPCS